MAGAGQLDLIRKQILIVKVIIQCAGFFIALNLSRTWSPKYHVRPVVQGILEIVRNLFPYSIKKINFIGYF